MKLRDVLLKPIGKITAKDGIDIIRPNGDVKDAENECCIYIGDRVKNSSDKAIALIINEREITLEPGQVTTVIPITYGVIQKIAKLQDEIVNGKTIEELENSAAGKELIKELSSLGEAIFEHSGHYSNIHASTDTIDFIKNIKQLEAAPSREPNIYENPNPISAPVSSPRIEAPTNSVHGAEPKVEPKSEPKPAPMLPFTKDHVVFVEDANGNGTLTVDENGNPFLFTTVRVKFPDNVRAFDIINVAKDDGSWTDGKVITNVGDGYVEFDMPIQNDFGKRVKLIVEHLNQNGDHIATVTNGLNIDKLPPLSDITFPEDANGDGTLGLTENTTNPNSTTVRVGIPSYSGSGDIITIKDKDGTTTLGSATLTPADKTRGYVEINVPVTKGKTLEIAVDLEHSTIKTKPVEKSLVIEPDPMPKLKSTDITFTEDADSDGKLTPAENQTDPNKTTVRVALPNDTLTNDVVNIKVKDSTHTGSHTVTTADKTRGYVEFEVPVTSGKTTNVVVNISRGSSITADVEKGLEVLDNHAPKIGANDIIFTEDTNSNGTLSIGENTTNPNATTVRVKLPNGIKANDKVVLEKKDGSHNDDKVITDNDITRGYVEFDTPISSGEKVEVKVHVERTHYISSTPTEKVLQVEPNLKLTASDIVFTEDTDKNGTLALTENTTTPNTTTVRVKLPSVIAENDIVKIKAVGTSITDNKTITSTDKTNGYVEFEVPLKGIKNLNIEALIQRGTKTYDSADKTLVIEKSPAPIIAANDITFSEDTNDNGHLSVGENQTNPATTTVKIDLPSGIKEGDIVTLKDNANHTYNKTITTTDKTDGHINFEVPVTRDTTLKVSVDVTRDTEKSTPATKDLIIDKPIPIIGAGNIKFTEDGDNNNILTPSENTTTPATTTVKITIPNDVNVGDKIKIADKNGTYTDSHVITNSDKTTGHISFEVPAKKGKTIDAEVKVERDGEDGISSHKELEVFQPMASITLTHPENTNGDGELTADENVVDPEHTTVRVTLVSDAVLGDKIKVTDLNGGGITQVTSHTIVAADLTRGYVDFEAKVSDGTTLYSKAWIERGSDSSVSAWKYLDVKLPAPGLPVREFSEDTNSDHTLTILENSTTPTTTTLAIAIDTSTVKVGDVIKVKDSNNASYTGTHTVTATDLAPSAGYITFEVPATKGATIKPRITVTRGSKTWGPDDYSMSDLKVEEDPRDQISLDIGTINTDGHITDADLGKRTIKAVIRVNHKELLNDGYEIEVKVYDKTIKAYKQDDGTYAADIRLADYKDDADQKITATLKNATVDMDDGSGHTLAMPVAEKTAEASYDTNFTRSVLDILNVNDYNVMTLADIKNNADVHINGEVRGIYYKTGDNVFLTLPNGNIITANVQADGTFSATVKPSALGYPTTIDPDIHPENYPSKEINTLIKGKYTNDTGTYNDNHNFKVDLHNTLFGLRPTLRLAENNDADITLVDATRNGSGILKKSINLEDTDKIYATPNGGKFKIDLNFDGAYSPSGWSRDLTNPPRKMDSDAQMELSKATSGWHYEIYLVKGKMGNGHYSGANFNTYDYGFNAPIKIGEGNVVNGKIKYTHDFDIKDYESTKPADNIIYSVHVKLIPPAGNHSYTNIKVGDDVYVFSADTTKRQNDIVPAWGEDEYLFADNINTFSNLPSSELFKTLGGFEASNKSDANTFYYTNSVEEVTLSGFALRKYNPTNAQYESNALLWTGSSPKPDSAYVMVNGVKYEGTIDPTIAKVSFKGVKTIDLKNDADHKYEIVFVSKDRYNNDVKTSKEFSYSVVDSGTIPTADVEKAFTIFAENPGLEMTEKDGFANTGVYSRAKGSEESAANWLAESLIYSVKNQPKVLFTLRNKYATHFDHDVTLKIDVALNGTAKGLLTWFDPSENREKKIINGEITIKAGTPLKDIRIVQQINDDDTLHYDEIDPTKNEYGGSVANSNMSLKKQKIIVTLKNSNNEVLNTFETYAADNDYDVDITSSSNFDIRNYTSGSLIFGGNRKVSLNNTNSSTFNVDGLDVLREVDTEFKNENANITLTGNGNYQMKKLIFSKGNNVINLTGGDNQYHNLVINDLTSNMSSSELASHPTYTLKFNRAGGAKATIKMKEDARDYDFQGLHILKGSSTASNKSLTLDFELDPNQADRKTNKYLKNLTIDEDVEIVLGYTWGRHDTTTHFENFNISSNGGAYIPTLKFTTKAKDPYKYEAGEFVNSTLEVQNIENAAGLIFKNSKIGINGSSSPINMSIRGDLELLDGSVLYNDTNVTAQGGKDAANNHYVIDTTIDKAFTLTDTTIANGGTNKFTFGSHANVGNHANFNVDNSELIFESGSEFHGKVKAGSGNNSITIKSGATFDGTIDMGDSISNIVIEQGAHLGPNFHIAETNTESEAVNGKYDTLTLFNDIDFTNLDVKGLDQINIGTQARGEMINMDIVFDELNSLLGGGKNTIKFWGDNDNRLTFHNEANRTFSVAADQSAVASQPYTRYEASDTATGTKYFIDVHNDINLQIL